jgi:hydrogenase-1 operon protein HyaF
MSLQDIPVRVDFVPPEAAEGEPGGMALALLREIADQLQAVAGGAARQVIELANLPLTEEDRALLSERLGRGEVEAQVQAAGPTEVFETAFPGVWWVIYRNEAGNPIGEQLEIGPVPMILEAHRDDIRASAERMAQELATPAGGKA